MFTTVKAVILAALTLGVIGLPSPATGQHALPPAKVATVQSAKASARAHERRHAEERAQAKAKADALRAKADASRR